MLWNIWLDQVNELQNAFSRKTTFYWFIASLMAVSIRCGDAAGVTSTIRVLGILPTCYPCLLNFYHSSAINLDALTTSWVQLAIRLFVSKVTLNNRLVLLIDGIKIAKEGKKMPAVKYLHQDSDSNSKAEYIMGHSLQAVTMLVRAGVNYFAVPLACRIHEGLTVKEKEKRTLLDKIFELIISLKIDSPLYIVADAYYAAAKFAEHLIQSDQHLVTRVKTNAVAYAPVTQQMGKNQRGRPKKYGDKIKVYSVFECLDQFTEAESSLYGETNVSILYHTKTLYWRRFGKLVRYVWAIHPKRGKIVLISTDLALTPLQIIKLYGLRFKIEVSFKQSVHTLGTYSYHFWLKSMKAIKRRTGNQDLNELSDHQQKKVLKKMKAYHVHIQIGLIAQGLLQYLSIIESKLVWKTFGSWIRTMRPEMAPSEGVAAAALKNSLPEFLSSCIKPSIFKKFIRKKIDFSRAEGMRFSY